MTTTCAGCTGEAAQVGWRACRTGWGPPHSQLSIWPKRAATLEVRGRHSGQLITLPVVIADYEGERYLVSMLGENANWVRNVRAAGGRAVLRHGQCEAVRLEEVATEQRPAILRRYLALAPGARPHIPIERHAPLEDFARLAPGIPVFRLVSEQA